ncbi:3-oxoacyl-ACP synthase III family protein [Streptomyces sp. NPDC059002]|uniref:3-oxoacyl-ACP synthase III family protein n=1 Tax=Streptomyces sp. NPDC059002 TaxID=3346690 RepID=UPI0036C45A3D
MDVADIHILSVGTALPGPPVDNATLAGHFGMGNVWEQWIDAFVGTRTRHLAVDLESGQVSHSLADLGESAARQALERAGLDAIDIDVVVLNTATPDQLMPTTANIVADRLGINNIPTYQVQSGCSGAVQAIELGRLLLLAGGHRTALVIGGDLCARFFDPKTDLNALPPGELVNMVLFGDGAGAVVLSTEPTPGATLLRSPVSRFTGLGRAPGQALEWFGATDQDGRPFAVEDYKAIEQHVPEMAAEILDELLDELDWDRGELTHLLPPQLSGKMTRTIMERLGDLPLNEISCVADTGNTGNGLPYLQLERAVAEMGPGDRAIGIAIESSKWIASGYALERL